jgi:SAM-dependent methyltransferase
VNTVRSAVDDYFRLMAEKGRSPGNLRFHVGFLFDGVDVPGKTVLDVGAGDGTYSFYVASAGAAKVVALEPEGTGSRAGVRQAFARTAARLGLDHVEFVPATLQEYEARERRFDVLLLNSSINHLDEDACTRLHHDPEAREVYLGLLRKLAGMAAPGAKLVAVDCSRRNLFARLGRNPIAPTIEWEKHQPPELWAELLGQVGFENPRIRWHSFNTFRSVGRLLLGNRVAAYLTTSVFCLTMDCAADGISVTR